MSTPMHLFTVRDVMRDSPTMSAAAMADAAKARGKAVEIVTVGGDALDSAGRVQHRTL